MKETGGFEATYVTFDCNSNITFTLKRGNFCISTRVVGHGSRKRLLSAHAWPRSLVCYHCLTYVSTYFMLTIPRLDHLMPHFSFLPTGFCYVL